MMRQVNPNGTLVYRCYSCGTEIKMSSRQVQAGSDFILGTYCARPCYQLGRIGDCIVKKVQEYLEHASECRTLARTAPPAHREQLEEMARTWEQLAEARRGTIKKQLKMKSARHQSAI
jgi:hypothetical protein